MQVIATDEAGYGPKLGPLVIAAISGQIKSATADPCCETAERQAIDAFRSFAGSVLIGGRPVRIDDSKSVYKPGCGLGTLHAVVSASHRWCQHSLDTVGQAMHHVAPDDESAIRRSPWLGRIQDHPLEASGDVADAIARWQSSGFQLRDIQTRIITAKRFNEICGGGMNKADLLTGSTLGLVRGAIKNSDQQTIHVYCDRHGGRRYYAGAIANCFEGSSIQTICESKSVSTYRVHWCDRQIWIRFTVKGDRFPPVALASMHAKYWRERLMDSLNDFFRSHHRRDDHSAAASLKPTAGYPLDADRFLIQVAPTLERLGIPRSHFVRGR